MYALIDRPEFNFGSIATVVPRLDRGFASHNGGDKIKFVCTCYGIVGAHVEVCPLGG